MRSRSARSGCASSGRVPHERGRDERGHVSATPRAASAPSLPRILGPIRPRPRWTETRLLAIVALALVVGSLSLGLTLAHRFVPYDPGGLAIYLAALGGAHLAMVLAGRRSDQILLPAVGLLGGISLLLMQRLPQDLVTLDVGGSTIGLGDIQLAWLCLAIAVATTLGIVVRSDTWLRRYKYTWAAVGIALLLLTFVLGVDVGGQRLTLRIGPVSGQPSELLKVILVVFLAGYLSENRPLLIEQDTRIGPLRLPPLPYLAPMVAMWAARRSAWATSSSPGCASRSPSRRRSGSSSGRTPGCVATSTRGRPSASRCSC